MTFVSKLDSLSSVLNWSLVKDDFLKRFPSYAHDDPMDKYLQNSTL